MKKTKCLMVQWGVFLLITFTLVFYISVEKKRLHALLKLSEKNSLLYLLSTQWLCRKINGEDVFACLKDKGYKKIAVYGKNHSSECLCTELEKMGIEVPCIIDDKAIGRYGDISIVAKNNIPKDVDAIIISNLGNTETIQKDLEDVCSGAILTLEDIVKWG